MYCVDDIHTHTPDRNSSTGFLLCSLVLHSCSTNYLGHGHGSECHSPSPQEAPPRPRRPIIIIIMIIMFIMCTIKFHYYCYH